MLKYNIHEAKQYFAQIMTKIANGNEIILVRSGRDFARLAPLKKDLKKRIAGIDSDKAWVCDSFNEPLPAELQVYFA